jgi:hypothetical protein
MEKISTVDRKTWIKHYLTLWNGALGLTEMEMAVMELFITRHMSMADEGLREPFIGKLLFSTEEVRKIMAETGISRANFNNYKVLLKKKKALIEVEGSTHVNPSVLPQLEITFKFNLID